MAGRHRHRTGHGAAGRIRLGGRVVRTRLTSGIRDDWEVLPRRTAPAAWPSTPSSTESSGARYVRGQPRRQVCGSSNARTSPARAHGPRSCRRRSSTMSTSSPTRPSSPPAPPHAAASEPVRGMTGFVAECLPPPRSARRSPEQGCACVGGPLAACARCGGTGSRSTCVPNAWPVMSTPAAHRSQPAQRPTMMHQCRSMLGSGHGHHLSDDQVVIPERKNLVPRADELRECPADQRQPPWSLVPVGRRREPFAARSGETLGEPTLIGAQNMRGEGTTRPKGRQRRRAAAQREGHQRRLEGQRDERGDGDAGRTIGPHRGHDDHPRAQGLQRMPQRTAGNVRRSLGRPHPWERHVVTRSDRRSHAGRRSPRFSRSVRPV